MKISAKYADLLGESVGCVTFGYNSRSFGGIIMDYCLYWERLRPYFNAARGAGDNRPMKLLIHKLVDERSSSLVAHKMGRIYVY